MESKVKRREWVKTAAIIFLAVLLVLTFFSNTIMNYSLPEVAVQMVNSGTINAKIRGSGTVGANETYDVTIKQTRRVGSVLVRVGQEVRAGDPLFLLEAEESEELKAAQMELDSMELSYQKSLIEAGNSSATENREVQKAQQDYNDALRIYNQYGAGDANSVTITKANAEKRLREMNAEKDKLEADKADVEKQKANAVGSGTITSTSTGYIPTDSGTGTTGTSGGKTYSVASVLSAYDIFKSDYYIYGDRYSAIIEYANAVPRGWQTPAQLAAAWMKDSTVFQNDLESPSNASASAERENILKSETVYDYMNGELQYNYKQDQTAYQTITADIADLGLEENVYNYYGKNLTDEVEKLHDSALAEHNRIEAEKAHYDAIIDQFEKSLSNLDRAITEQQALITDLSAAASAAETVKATKEALEDLIFRQNLGDSGSLDIQAAKDAIEKKKEDIEKLTLNADEVEVTAKVSGRIGEINVTAGSQVGAEEVMARIQMVDRGYTLKIPVTNEQAKKVKVGDKAELVNYWGGDVEAILESIANDPQNQGKGRLLVFRLNGEVEADTNLTLSIGQKSANFDCLVPKSAVRTDSNGSFVLVMTAKSSPLGNRYTATRAEVEVLASDDKMSAVTGLSYGDFVITTSSKPIEAGQQVRQVDES